MPVPFILGGMAAIGGFLSITSANREAQALKAQAEFQGNQLEANAKISEFQAEQTVKFGDRLANQARAKGRSIAAAQRASFAAQNVDVDTGTAVALQDEASLNAQRDALTIRNNAWREAFGYKAQAVADRSTATYARISGREQARNTILTGYARALGDFSRAGGYVAKG